MIVEFVFVTYWDHKRSKAKWGNKKGGARGVHRLWNRGSGVVSLRPF